MKSYLPEWKLYLWKKVLLDKSNPETIFQLSDFIYFNQEDQFSVMSKQMRNDMDRIQNARLGASVNEGKMVSNWVNDTPFPDQYWNFKPKEVMSALIELAEERPKFLDIKDIKLRKDDIYKYRQERKDYLLSLKRKHLASRTMVSRNGNVYTPEPDNRFTDPFCGLPEHIYKKVDDAKKLTLSDLAELVRGTPQESLYDLIRFKIQINKEIMLAHMNAYINDFMVGNLVPPQGVRYLKFDQQKNDILNAIQSLATKYGSTNMAITFEEIARCSGWEDMRERYYRFYETLFALEKSGDIEIKDLRMTEVIISFLEKTTEKNITSNNESSTEVTDRIGFLLHNGEKIEIGPANNIPFIMLDVFLPFGKPVAVDTALKMTTSDRSKYKIGGLSILDKQDTLRNRIKELQKILPKKKLRVHLVFKESDGTVFMEESR